MQNTLLTQMVTLHFYSCPFKYSPKPCLDGQNRRAGLQSQTSPISYFLKRDRKFAISSHAAAQPQVCSESIALSISQSRKGTTRLWRRYHNDSHKECQKREYSARSSIPLTHQDVEGLQEYSPRPCQTLWLSSPTTSAPTHQTGSAKPVQAILIKTDELKTAVRGRLSVRGSDKQRIIESSEGTKERKTRSRDQHDVSVSEEISALPLRTAA